MVRYADSNSSNHFRLGLGSGLVASVVLALVTGANAQAQTSSSTASSKKAAASVSARSKARAVRQAKLVAANVTVPEAPASTSASLSLKTPVEEKKKKTELKWRVRLAGNQYQNNLELTQWVSFLLQADATHKVSDSILFKTNLYASMKSSYDQSRLGEYHGLKNSVGMIEGYMQVKPWEPLAIQVGILDQDVMNAPLLMDQIGWPAVAQQVNVGDEYSAEIRAEQAIPTASDLSTKTTELEPTPGFTMETLTLSAAPKDSYLHAKAWGGHYMFHNLASATAAASDIGGNTLIETADGTTDFKFGFEGWLAGGEAKLVFGDDFSWKVGGHVIQNTRAPEKFRNGQMLGTGLKVTLPGNIVVEPSADMFFVESDVGPSAYNVAEYGHNNRQGWQAMLGTTFKNHGFKITGLYIDAEPLNPHPLQVRQQFMLLRFETLYELL